MTTWICKPALLVAALLGLGACDGVQPGDLLGGLSAGGLASQPQNTAALSQTEMGKGAFTLIPPQGFCIDANTLRQNFALMARCDTLGAPDQAGGAPVGIITVSVSAIADAAPLPAAQDVADAAKLARFDAEKSEVDALTFRAEGAPPAAGLDVVHWRGVARVGGRVLGIALYGPKGGRAVTTEGREVINSLIRRSRAGA